MQVCKWGNSLAIRLPAAIVEILDLKEGDDIQIGVTGDSNLTVNKSPSNLEVLARLRKYRGTLPADFQFDRLEANERD
jgi:antitoxin MazE